MSQSIAQIDLLESPRCKPSSYIKSERDGAIKELLEENCFQPVQDNVGPYKLKFSIQDHRLVIEVENAEGEALPASKVSLRPYKRIIKDYFLMVESYNNARYHGGDKLEAIDMGRRAVHNEGSEMLEKSLSSKIKIDLATARRLFTLICVMHIGQVRGPRI